MKRQFTVYSLFFQAEDGIRYLTVTGVQTCALPICVRARAAGLGAEFHADGHARGSDHDGRLPQHPAAPVAAPPAYAGPRDPAGGDCRLLFRSEERRVGKECRSRWSPYPLKKKKECH